uniref:Mitochondrial carrier protein n=1 Tax=Trypanosoma congolense (strain IL3000) TaxID=1068625 RepID=G0UNC2_TRYCI|nr:conserved hypothetical protein [Trypanosoma congolense IL3000]
MQTSGGTAGYHATFPFRPVGSYCDPVVRVHGYTEPKLNWTQHTTVILGASAAAAWLKRPIEKLHAFYFLCDVPGDSSRIYASDKRAHFFRTLFGVRWFAGPSVLWALAEYAFQLVVFTQLRDSLPFGGNTIRGFVAGGLTGAIYTAFCHPYHVLRATAEAEKSMGFLGASDVFRRAITERPAVLLDIYRGAAVASCGQMFLLGSTFGFYNATRYDGVYHHSGCVVRILPPRCVFGEVAPVPLFVGKAAAAHAKPSDAWTATYRAVLRNGRTQAARNYESVRRLFCESSNT